MNIPSSLRDTLHHALEQAAEGWYALRQRASHALTRFTPKTGSGPLQTAEEALLQGSSRWGLLAAEVKEEQDALVVRLEAPGMAPEDFDLDIMDDVLVIRGEKRAEREENAGRYYLLERAYGAFERIIHLPAAVDQDNARAHYRHGVLTLTLPKALRQGTRRIPVNGE